nr:MAG TPA: hypothetical protein [Bacteriophage sp.]
MSKELFASKIIESIKSVAGKEITKEVALQYHNKVLEAISSYLQENLQVTLSYKGTLTNGSTDPIVTANNKVKISKMIQDTLPGTFDLWVSDLESKIIEATFTGTGLAPASLTVTVQAVGKGLTGILKQESLSKTTEQKDAWETICGLIIQWLNSTSSKKSASAYRTGSTGTATVTKLVIN